MQKPGKKIKVSVIEPVGGHGGMNYYNSGLCNGLSEHDCNVTLFTSAETNDSESDNFKLVKSFKKIYGKDPVWKRGLRFIKASIISVISSRANGVSLFHFHFFHTGLIELFNIIMVKLVLGKVIITVHDIESFAPGSSHKMYSIVIFKMADILIVHNEFSKRELLRTMPSLRDKINVIHHGNYLNYVEQLPDSVVSRHKLGIPSDADVLLFFGQIKEVKGLDILIKSLSIARKNNSRLHLIIAGKVWKDDFSRYQLMLDQYDLNEHCSSHIRYIPDEDVSYFYAAADLIVLPYRKIYQSGVLLMAMSFGKVVLASDLPGMKEVIDDNSGFLFDTENAESLSHKIVEIFNDKQKMTDIENGARNLMRDKYDWSAIGLNTQNVYSSIVNYGR